jgi:hypothetical protein
MAIFIGTKKKNSLNGTNDDDEFFGFDGNDQINAGAGNDTISGGRGHDNINGGSGRDTAVFSGKACDYDIEFRSDGTVSVKGKDGHDTLRNVEILTFDDRDVILVGGGGSEITTIQGGVDLAGATDGDIVLVAKGTYAEQVTVNNKVLSIKGQGDATKIVAPAVLVANVVDPGPTSTPGKNALIGVNGGNVSIEDLKIDGGGRGNDISTASGAADYNGIYFLNAGGEIDDVTITGIRDATNPDGSLSGNQRGNAILVANRDGVAREVEVSDSLVTDFQKNGMTFIGTGLTVEVEDNVVIGGGLQPLGSPAQNGIQVSGGATGIIDDNWIANLGYGPDSFSASGVLVFNSNNVQVTDNKIFMVQDEDGNSQDAAIAFVNADAPVAEGNLIVGAGYGIYQLGLFTNELSHSGNIYYDLGTHGSPDVKGTAVGFYADQGGQSYQFTGSRADDEIQGNNGADTLNGGRGDDNLYGDSPFGGGTGDDTFVFTRHSDDDTIWDFGQTAGNRDVMDVSAYHFHNFAQLQSRIEDNDDGNAVVHMTAHDSITLVGVQASDLTALDFVI